MWKKTGYDDTWEWVVTPAEQRALDEFNRKAREKLFIGLALTTILFLFVVGLAMVMS
jgi:hypothetical protein